MNGPNPRLVLSGSMSVYPKMLEGQRLLEKYGIPSVVPIPEDSPKQPINPYGFTKLAMERALADYAHAYGLGYAVLRYFNACGASSDATIACVPLTIESRASARSAPSTRANSDSYRSRAASS